MSIRITGALVLAAVALPLQAQNYTSAPGIWQSDRLSRSDGRLEFTVIDSTVRITRLRVNVAPLPPCSTVIRRNGSDSIMRPRTGGAAAFISLIVTSDFIVTKYEEVGHDADARW